MYKIASKAQKLTNIPMNGEDFWWCDVIMILYSYIWPIRLFVCDHNCVRSLLYARKNVNKKLMRYLLLHDHPYKFKNTL
jgi:hypothetical protein